VSWPTGSRRRGRPLLAAGLALAFAAPPLPAAAASLGEAERSVLNGVNAARSEHGLPPVTPSAPLERSARFHSQDMVAHSYFAHGPFWQRMVGFGAQGPRVGEDLAWTAAPGDATRTVLRLWLASPAHRAVLLRPGFRRIGIGVAVGPFMGFDRATVVTADFEGT
jgi:uncharacterized protein YkwD